MLGSAMDGEPLSFADVPCLIFRQVAVNTMASRTSRTKLLFLLRSDDCA
jgi:hypothetical protein